MLFLLALSFAAGFIVGAVASFLLCCYLVGSAAREVDEWEGKGG